MSGRQNLDDRVDKVISRRLIFFICEMMMMMIILPVEDDQGDMLMIKLLVFAYTKAT